MVGLSFNDFDKWLKSYIVLSHCANALHYQKAYRQLFEGLWLCAPSTLLSQIRNNRRAIPKEWTGKRFQKVITFVCSHLDKIALYHFELEYTEYILIFPNECPQVDDSERSFLCKQSSDFWIYLLLLYLEKSAPEHKALSTLYYSRI